MIHWNPDALEWQATDTLSNLLDMIREHGREPKATASLAELEERLFFALAELRQASEEANHLESLTYKALHRKLAGLPTKAAVSKQQ